MDSLSEILFHEILNVRWLNNVFLFSTEIWTEQLKKHPDCVVNGTQNIQRQKRYTIPHFLLAFLAVEAVAQGNAGLTQATRCSNTSIVKLPMNLRVESLSLSVTRPSN